MRNIQINWHDKGLQYCGLAIVTLPNEHMLDECQSEIKLHGFSNQWTSARDIMYTSSLLHQNMIWDNAKGSDLM